MTKKKGEKKKQLRISGLHREKLRYYLKEFYKRYPEERYTIFHFVKYFKERLKHNKDAWIGLSGETGSGKSYFALMAMVLFGRPVGLENNVSYLPQGQEIVDKLGKLRFGIFLVDEAAREMRSVNWQSKQQQSVNVKAMTDRFHNNMVFLNMPNFNEFTKSMRRGNLQFRVIVLYRTPTHARVIVQRKSRNWRSDDPWGDILANERYERTLKKYKELDNERILAIERHLPSTVMDFIVPNLALVLGDVCEEYERLKLESREQEQEANEEKEKRNVYKEKYEHILMKVTKILVNNTLGLGQVKVTRKEMCEALGVSEVAFRKYLKKLPPVKPEHRK